MIYQKIGENKIGGDVMKIKNLIASTAVIVLLTSSSVVAAPVIQENDVKENKTEWRNKYDDFEKNPITALEENKNEILQLLKEDKLTKEKADAIISRIDAKISKIKAFEKLPLAQKKEALIKDCKARLDTLVKDGKIQKDKADAILKKYTEKIQNWDGIGYPDFHDKGIKGKGKHN